MDETLDQLIIRRIRLEDAEEISRIQATITKASDPTDFAEVISEQLRRNEDASFVAEVDGKVAGFMISYTVNAGFGLEKSAWIATLGVHPRFMGQGLGKRLAGAIFQVYRQRGINRIFTSVRWDSVDLLSFFKTLGFDRSSFINLEKSLDGP